MILLVNPRATRPSNRRFPLSIMAVGAALPPEIDWEIVDGNLPGIDVLTSISRHIDQAAGTSDPVQAVALTVMPGPQLVSAVPLSQALKAKYPAMPIVWGGNFGSLYPEPVLNAPYVDWVIRGQGENTFVELIEAIEGRRDPKTIAGLGFRQADGSHWLAPERPWIGPDQLPAPPYHKIDVGQYLHPTFLGRKSGVYQASIGCPHGCNFCGVISVYGRKEKLQSPKRTAEHLRFLVEEHGMDSVHFYDNNFFVGERHAQEIAERFKPLGLRWWCEARVDTLSRFSDATWRALREAGLTMVFCGAESGSDEVLKKMNKGTTTDQIVEVARRSREHGIIPEFSFVFGDPDEPEREIENTLGFIRKLKTINPAMELITYFYTPTPQRRDTYGNIDAMEGTPDTLEEWTTPEWVAWMTHENPIVPWLDQRLKARVEDFELILKSRFPSVHDRRTRPWGKVAGRIAAWGRWEREDYSNPQLLRRIRKLAEVIPADRQAYGHLRPVGDASATP
ncbi:MAG: Radical domain protein [Sphingomonas bacterium]|uniref:B12-binding domain-containing radical SAM protein n=1 Tax=Sphingomonas bacterium TaxID=1895847 RepID=UPI00262F873E|nr:radical SAM protein [Sphingomonas bacterium]MDB5703921.1 Radical domain protein [Sphingomonas bacterium]